MIIFTPEEIDELLSHVDVGISEFIMHNLGSDSLRSEDIDSLREHGIDITELEGFTPYEQAFYFGRLVDLIGEDNSRIITYDDLLKYFSRGQYLPLSQEEGLALEIAKRRSYAHIKGLGERIHTDIDRIITDFDYVSRKHYEDTISDAHKQAILERKGVSSIISSIGNRTQDWQRDLGRIAETELNTIFQEGIAASILKDHGGDALVYKDVFPGACRHCISLYLTKGLGSQPRLFKLSDLIANGTNIGRKVADWKATLGSLHPWCRCQLRLKPEDSEWSNEKRAFVPVKYVSKYKNIAPIIVEVGDKRFEVRS